VSVRRLIIAAVATTLIMLAAVLALDRLVGGGSDAEVARRVGDKLEQLSNASHSPLRVHSEDGVVYLSGAVESPDELLQADRLARHTRGVRGAVNGLIISSQAQRVASASP
jgi:hypothetical protein